MGSINVSEEKSWINGNAMVVHPKNDKEISRDYLYLLLNGGVNLSSAISGSAQPQITRTTLSPIKISLPPLSEQKNIVARLEKLLAKIKEAKRLRAEAQEAAQNLLFAELHKIFEEGKKREWEEKEIKEVCDHPQYGYTASAKQEKVGPKFLRITDIQNGRVNWETVPYCKCEDVEKYNLEKGDIVFARTGATVGKSYLIDKISDKSVFL